ncbi:hypothetical protein [Nostoc sp.]|uniref:hypothetical protein n=1 Tax=Nostoc sp. TaxID=1180 RepID=UPI002FFC4385
MPVARIHLGILCDWWMNKRRFCTPTKFSCFVVNFRSGGSESPTDCILTNVFFFNQVIPTPRLVYWIISRYNGYFAQSWRSLQNDWEIIKTSSLK